MERGGERLPWLGSLAALAEARGDTRHAALVARQFGTPAVVGVEKIEIDLDNHRMQVGEDLVIREGEYLSIDGNLGWEPLYFDGGGSEVIDTGLEKFGAILGDDAVTGCNSVLNPGTILGKNAMVYACAAVRGYVPHDTVVKLKQTLENVPRT